MNRSFRGVVAGLACAVSLALSHPVAALSYVMMSDQGLFDEAEGVARVRVIEQLPSADFDQETRYRVRVERLLAGRLQGDTQVLALPGTFASPNVNMVVPGVPRISDDAELIVFFSRRADGALLPQQLTLGLFGKVTGPDGEVFVRHLEKAGDVGKSVLFQQFHGGRDGAAFERWIVDRAHGVDRAPDYLVPAPDQQEKFVFSSFQPAGLQNFPGRWFQFDTDQSLNWQARSDGQSGVGANSFTMLQQALAGWTNDATSRITMAYSGTADAPQSCSVFNSGTTTAGCFSGHVKWNDPNGQIGGTFSGTGTLAFGGSSASSSLLFSFDGSSWYQRLLGFVVVQDGTVGTVMNGNSGADGTELLTHEVGHAIGFGHSCELAQSQCVAGSDQDEATMRSAIQRDGRGANLGVDDIAGAAVIYPAPAPANVGPTLTAASPSSGSTTAMGTGGVGDTVSSNISFNRSGGSGTGTTSLVCSASAGTVSVASGGNQSIAVGGTVNPVVARFTLTSSAQTGTVSCTATPQGGSASNFSYNFTAAAGTGTGPTLSAASPANGSTTAMAGGDVGATTESQITFNRSGGANGGTTALQCVASNGTVSVVSGGNQTIAVGGSVNPVVARFTLSSSAQTGRINCTATPQGGSVVEFSYDFTAPAGSPGTPVGECNADSFFRTGFEENENNCVAGR